MIIVETRMMFHGLEECEDAKQKMPQKQQEIAGMKNNVMQQKQKACPKRHPEVLICRLCDGNMDSGFGNTNGRCPL